MTKMTTIPENYNNIRAEIVELLKAARSAAARNVNSIMTATYWEIGRRIVAVRATRRGASRIRPTIGGTTCQRPQQAIWPRVRQCKSLENARLLPVLGQSNNSLDTVERIWQASFISTI